MAESYMEDETVRRYYEGWIDKPTAFTGHHLDDERFYKFVKACVQFARGGDIRKTLVTSVLRPSLVDSFSSHSGMSESVYRDECDKVVSRFEELVAYEATNLD